MTSSEGGAEAVYERPPETSPGTLRGLGPHIWEATLDRRGDRQGIHPSRESVLRLVWAGLDEYEFIEFGEDATLRFEEIRLDRDLFRRASTTADYSLLAGTPGDSIILQRTLRTWDSCVSPFGAQAAYERLADSTLDGRPVRVYGLALAPPIAPDAASGLTTLEAAANQAGMAVTPVSLTGRVYVDIETGNRLLAELEGRYVPRRVMGNTDPTDEVLISCKESRATTQLPPTITAPPPDRVKDRTRSGLPLPAVRGGSLDPPRGR